jgi:hypothetical protein
MAKTTISLPPTSAPFSQVCWPLDDGRQVPIELADIVRVPSDFPGVPYHYGLIWDMADLHPDRVQVIHCNKDCGVDTISYSDFSGDDTVRWSGRASSPEHQVAIIHRAADKFGTKYDALYANCEQFVDYCYTGENGRSVTRNSAVLACGAIATIFILAAVTPSEE